MKRPGTYQLLAWVEADVVPIAKAQAKAAGIPFSDWVARAVREQAKRERGVPGVLFGGGEA